MSMPAIERVIPLVGHLPSSIREALARRLRELGGLGLVALSGVAAAALMTWSVQDPSLSHATSRPIRNIIGHPGAIGADLLMQILGLGSIMLILPVAVWGWRMLTHRPFDRHALRIGCWILCTMISAGFASCWPHGGAWPLPTGLGGVVGDALVRAPAVVFGPPGIIYRLVLGTLLAIAGLTTFLIAGGLGSRPQEQEESARIEEDDAGSEDEDDAGSVSLGWAFHAAMSAKARLWRLLTVAYAKLVASAPPERAGLFERQEPHLGARAARPQSEDHFEEEDDPEEEAPARPPRKKPVARIPSRKSSSFAPICLVGPVLQDARGRTSRICQSDRRLDDSARRADFRLIGLKPARRSVKVGRSIQRRFEKYTARTSMSQIFAVGLSLSF